MESTEENLFDKAMERYQGGTNPSELIEDFQEIVNISPNNAAGWTCLAWLQLLTNQSQEGLRSARLAVKLNPQDPQARINLSLALLETKSKGVRDHIDFVKRALLVMPELSKELQVSLDDGLNRKPDWDALNKIKNWLDL
tara:strand:+ start:103 stop:522 length:420 start_codon:yes stop_codon:yes gene_type:complete